MNTVTKRIVWVITVILCVAAYSVWGYISATLSGGRNVLIPCMYLGTWAVLFALASSTRSRTAFITSLAYWTVVFIIAVASFTANTGIAQTFLQKYLTIPTAAAVMPFVGFFDPNSADMTALYVTIAVISAILALVCTYFIARIMDIHRRTILVAIFPFTVSIGCFIASVSGFAEMFISYRNGGAQPGSDGAQTVVSVIFILGWAFILTLCAYTGSHRIAFASFVYWCVSLAASVFFAISYTKAAVVSSLFIASLGGFCPSGAFPGVFSLICAGVSAVMAIASLIICRVSRLTRIGYLR